jgi:hypothetical protein
MKWIHKLLKYFSFSAVLFTFQACYGTDEDLQEYDYDIAVHVIDSDGNGIPNVEVRTSNAATGANFFVDTTSASGMAYVKGVVWDVRTDMLKFEFNPLENTDFKAKDTTIAYSKMSDRLTIMLNRK